MFIKQVTEGQNFSLNEFGYRFLSYFTFTESLVLFFSVLIIIKLSNLGGGCIML